MDTPDFEDFVLEGGWELLFPDDEDVAFECSHCERIIKGNEEVEWVSEDRKVFKCPSCEMEIKI